MILILQQNYKILNKMIAAKKHHQVHEQTIKQDKKKEQGHVAAVEIQFCTNCDAHLFAVRHQQAKYSQHYQNIKKRLMESKIAVRKRAVPQNLYKKSPYCPSNVYYRNDNNQLVYFPQIGSFEVYFSGKKIFSKLESLKWPTPESIISQVQKITAEKKEQSVEIQPQPQKQENTEHDSKKGQFRIKNRNDEHLHFRYSIDKRNLFKKPDNNYLNRKSLTARNQSNQESVHRKNNLNSSEKRVNEEQLPSTEGRNRKDLSDDYVIQIYQKKPAKPEEKHEQHAINFPEIPKKKRRKSGGTNVYLQPIFPKTSVNLQSYSRQRAIFATKIHQQRKSYEASKNQPKSKPEVDLMRESSKARFNEDCNSLFKDKQPLLTKDLKNIKEATEENEIKERQQKNQIVPDEKAVKEVPVVAENKIEHSNELIPHSQSQKSANKQPKRLPEKIEQKLEDIPRKQQPIVHNIPKQTQELPHAQTQINNNIDKDSHIDAIQPIEPSVVNIDKIATTKTIHQADKNKLNSQENAYEEEFQPEEEKVNQEIQQKQKQKQQTEKVQIHRQPEAVQPQPQQEQEYQNQEFQQEKEKEEKEEKEEKLNEAKIEQADALVETINKQNEQIVANLP